MVAARRQDPDQGSRFSVLTICSMLPKMFDFGFGDFLLVRCFCHFRLFDVASPGRKGS